MLRSLQLNCKGTRTASIDWADQFELWQACGERYLVAHEESKSDGVVSAAKLVSSP